MRHVVVVSALAVAAVLVASAGAAQAAPPLSRACHGLNQDVIGKVGLLNPAIGNALNGEGSPGAQLGC